MVARNLAVTLGSFSPSNLVGLFVEGFLELWINVSSSLSDMVQVKGIGLLFWDCLNALRCNIILWYRCWLIPKLRNSRECLRWWGIPERSSTLCVLWAFENFNDNADLLITKLKVLIEKQWNRWEASILAEANWPNCTRLGCITGYGQEQLSLTA